jgi:histidine triad (HIT) family protein
MVAGEIPIDEIYQDEQVLAFNDISPQAPTHILVIPRNHITSIAHARPGDEAVLGHILGVVRDIAASLGLDVNGYRTVINTGREGGQSVYHLHAHLLGGRAMTWPPG